MLDSANGLEYLHAREPAVVHRDVRPFSLVRLTSQIKSLNILITSKGRAKLADFGLARVKTSANSLLRTSLGTLNCACAVRVPADHARASAGAVGAPTGVCVGHRAVELTSQTRTRSTSLRSA